MDVTMICSFMLIKIQTILLKVDEKACSVFLAVFTFISLHYRIFKMGYLDPWLVGRVFSYPG